MADENPDELVITQEEMEKTIIEAIDQFLLGKHYNEALVPRWISDINEDIIKKLVLLQKPYKYMANCMIMQKNGAACASSNTTLWDSTTDISMSLLWPNKQTKAEQTKSTMQCIVGVYAVKFTQL